MFNRPPFPFAFVNKSEPPRGNDFGYLATSHNGLVLLRVALASMRNSIDASEYDLLSRLDNALAIATGGEDYLPLPQPA